MSKFKPSSGRRQMTISDHVQRLPVVRQLDASHQNLVQLNPGWKQWMTDNLTDDASHQAILSAYKNGVLLIACENAAVASQIKHQQHSLVEYFHQLGFAHVTQVTVNLAHANQISSQSKSINSSEPSSELQPTTTTYSRSNPEAPNKRALDAIAQTQNSIKNESLSNALKRLEKTLKNI